MYSPKIFGIYLPHFFAHSLIIQRQWHPVLAIWKSFSMAAEPLNMYPNPPSTTHLTQIFRCLAATLNDFQMAKTRCHCVCVIKLYTKNVAGKSQKIWDSLVVRVLEVIRVVGVTREVGVVWVVEVIRVVEVNSVNR